MLWQLAAKNAKIYAIVVTVGAAATQNIA